MRMTELLKSVFVDVYRLDYSRLFLLLLAATVCFLFLHKRYRENHLWRFFLGAVLLVWTALVVYYTVGSRGGSYTGAYNLIPFHSYREIRNGGNPEIYRSNLMNTVLFYPNGLLAAALLSETWPKWRRILAATVVFAGLSVGIEYAQYVWRLGRVEIDDVIHNTAGALAGSLAALLMPLLISWLAGKYKRLWEQYDRYRK